LWVSMCAHGSCKLICDWGMDFSGGDAPHRKAHKYRLAPNQIIWLKEIKIFLLYNVIYKIPITLYVGLHATKWLKYWRTYTRCVCVCLCMTCIYYTWENFLPVGARRDLPETTASGVSHNLRVWVTPRLPLLLCEAGIEEEDSSVTGMVAIVTGCVLRGALWYIAHT
jgi:hypothetical protein